MKVLKKIIITLADFEDYLGYKFKRNKKKSEYDQLELDIDRGSKSPEKIAFFSNLKRDFVILIILALIGTIFISINKQTKNAVHISNRGVESIEFQNFGIGGGVSMLVDEKEDIELILDTLNKIEKEKDIDLLTENIEDSINDESYMKLIINFKKENKESKIIEIRDSKILTDGKEIITKVNSFSNLWYKLNYKVTNIE